VVAPADHVIIKEIAFQNNVRHAIDTAQEDVLVTLGIMPTRPDTGYGYIQFQTGDAIAKTVKTFTEKPHLELAEAFLESGDYVWNAGLFVFKIPVFKRELEKHLSRLAEQFEEGEEFYYTNEEQDFIRKVYAVCKSVSIDNGIMEKAQIVKVILADIGWSDLGTWKSLYEIQEKDSSGNVIDGNVIVFDTQNCIIKTPSEKLIVVQGLQNFIVAEHENALMICPQDQEQEVKKFVEAATYLNPKYS
jgi:mannose-1-phosphate guanylyltransferase